MELLVGGCILALLPGLLFMVYLSVDSYRDISRLLVGDTGDPNWARSERERLRGKGR
ncbi:MAG: hypothetical protein ACE5JO_11770 [Candidatus Binatia bacterium]